MDYSKRVEIERLRALRSALTTFSGGSFILACASCVFSDSLSVSPELSTFLFGIVGLASYCKSIECSDRISDNELNILSEIESELRMLKQSVRILYCLVGVLIGIHIFN